EEQQEPLRGIVQSFLDPAAAAADDHPRAHASNEPDAEGLARDFATLREQLAADGHDAAALAQVRDRLTLLAAPVPGVRDGGKGEHCQQSAAALWQDLR